ncbi:MAG: hypothetical protein H6704_23060 [Myxococcales bacterium]|nr:hypothetical protein [Myxococcales bacterium]
MRWRNRLWAAVLLCGCGYGWVRPDAGGPVPAVRLGVFDDRTAEGDLGLRVGARLRRLLAARQRPTLGAGPTLEGVLRPIDEAPVGFDRAARGALYHTGVEMEMRLVGEGDALLWSSGPVVHRVAYARGSTPLATRDARRAAVGRAAEQAADDLFARFVVLEALP